MSVCHFCGAQNEEWMKICQECGNPVIDHSKNDDEDNNSNSNNDNDYYEEDEGTKKKNNMDLKLVLGILSLILVVLIIYTLFVLL